MLSHCFIRGTAILNKGFKLQNWNKRLANTGSNLGTVLVPS